MILRSLFLSLIVLLSFQKAHARGAAEYSEATDVFEIMDHVTRWDPSLTAAYRTAWEKKFPLDLETKGDFSSYAQIRLDFYEKHKEETVENDIFGSGTKGYDSFSDAFYSSKSIGEALRKLESRGMGPGSIKFLVSFYRKYKKKISAFVKESSHFPVRLLEINNRWKKQRLGSTMKNISQFVLGKEGRKFKLVLRPVWWPSNLPPEIDIRGPYLIVRFNPLNKSRQIPMEELASKGIEATLSAQKSNQRKNLTKIFRANCTGREIELKAALTILFAAVYPKSVVSKKSFDLYANWSRSVFVDLYVKLLFPLFERELKNRKNTFAGTFMDQATLLCKKINRLSIAP
jgi:hypothetical protein